MNKKIIAGGIVAALIVVAGAFWLFGRNNQNTGQLTLYGNVDIRQVSLAFENNGRISTVTVDEGDHVKAGQILATLDTKALEIQEQQAVAQLDVQKQTVREQQAGARPEEIAQAKAQLASAQAQLQKATEDITRIQRISATTGGKGISKQELDMARSSLLIAQASVKERQANLTLMEKGVRKEQREASVAQVRATQAQLALMQYHISQAELRSPVDAVVRARLQEPGDMTGPQKAVFTLAMSEPKWVRVWLSQNDLGRVRSGMTAQIRTDSFPDNPVQG
ncbi:HlyD family efflux transporter periplasmic adaptor subunit [Pantoea sp. AS-PWVM4]|uniref:HlyD family efflux transporter periplasmic adaptor subunit n=1 Tax=Pantoea sp. AS-PWVM4 TaxID=1332069 RepID=UPI0004203531|nr:HlyD family efflux transporter periplasmic adaptor subunit [Pantoea sp. AS-PWVM4]